MSNGYEVFAQYYDTLTQNIDYRKRALYFDFLLQKYGVKPERFGSGFSMRNRQFI